MTVKSQLFQRAQSTIKDVVGSQSGQIYRQRIERGIFRRPLKSRPVCGVN